jgi:hypothetical protein
VCCAKNSQLSAIEIYPVGTSQAYVQIEDFSLNLKNELRLCNGAAKVDKESYGKLPKIILAPGMTLERNQNGVLMLSRGAQPECAVPGNLKIDKSGAVTPAELADKATLLGQVISKSDGAAGSVAPFAPGVKIVLVRAPDNELAEFLLAQRSNKIERWKTYLVRFPAAPHSTDAKASLSHLYVQDGNTSLDAFKTSRAGAPDYGRLQAAKHSLDDAVLVDPGATGQDLLAKGIDQQVADLDGNAQDELKLYREAFKDQTAGYRHLPGAESISQITVSVEPQSSEALSLSSSCKEERAMLESRIQNATSKLAAGHPDDAYLTLAPVRAFAVEYPRVQDSLNAIYRYHLNLGKKDVAGNDLSGATVEFQKAFDVQATAEAADLLKGTQQQAQDSFDKAAVTAALGRSNDAEADHDYVTAYEVLDSLTPTQKTAVSARIDGLKEQFVPAAISLSKQLQHAHTPIKGLADERAVQKAYNLLQKCYLLNNDPALQDQSTVLGEILSA